MSQRRPPQKPLSPPPPRKPPRPGKAPVPSGPPWWVDSSRNLIIAAVALYGVYHETVYNHLDRPYLFGLFAAMLGLPIFLGFDRKRRRGDEDE